MIEIQGHELVGHRQQGLVGHLPPERMVQLWTASTSRIIKRGFIVELRDLEPPRTGIFDGLRIVIDPDVYFEMQCFVLLHLFGHSVQWVAPTLEHKLEALQHTTELAQFMGVLHDYEFEAARFGLTLLHEAGIHDLDGWYSDFVETDWRYVEGYYRTNEIPPWKDCVVTGAAPVAAAPIPELRHRQVEVRFAF